MDLGSLLRVLGRRWLVLLIGALLTLGAAGLAYTQTPSRYQSTARMLLLLPSNSRGEQAVGSPFLYLPNGLTVLARIVALTPTSRDFQIAMVQEGFRSQYEIGVDNASPTLTISVEGSDPDNVIATRDRLIQAMNEDLLAIQREEKAPPQQIAHTRVYAAESTPEQIGGDRARAVIAVGGAGALLTLILVFLIDRVGQLRAARRAARPDGKLSRKERRRARKHERVGETAGQAAAAVGTEAVVAGDKVPADEDLATWIHDAAYDGDPEDLAVATEADEPVPADAEVDDAQALAPDDSTIEVADTGAEAPGSDSQAGTAADQLDDDPSGASSPTPSRAIADPVRKL